ncbi:MAG: entericidin A/B family lipoprotein [Chthoniobacterales bacterium]|nr:entericidin A/B family lipoprotein [Chthoniobacterales bacterium]
MKKLILSFLLLVIAITFMTGCNTISGMGRDVSAVGNDVSKGANTVSRKMSN